LEVVYEENPRVLVPDLESLFPLSLCLAVPTLECGVSRSLLAAV
jgi:hypothetical protein